MTIKLVSDGSDYIENGDGEIYKIDGHSVYKLIKNKWELQEVAPTLADAVKLLHSKIS